LFVVGGGGGGSIGDAVSKAASAVAPGSI